MDKNGYAESIMDTEPGRDYMLDHYFDWYYDAPVETVRHEVYYGRANRLTSKREGFWINVTPEMHRKIHATRELSWWLKRECQRVYEKEHSREEFRALIGRSYL